MKIKDINEQPKNPWMLKEESISYEKSLYEGLIISASDSDIFKYLKTQKLFPGLWFGKEEDSRLWVRITTPIKGEDLSKLVKGFEIRGWFMSIASLDYRGNIPYDDRDNPKYHSPFIDIRDSNELIKMIESIHPNFLLTMTFEAKYTKDAKDIIQNLKYLYHATPVSKVDKILKNGLSPKSGSKVAYHPDRVYLSTDLNHLEKYLLPKLAYSTDFEDTWVILGIDTKLFKNYPEKKIFEDPAAPNAVFTYTNISPAYIAKVKEVKTEIK